MNFGGNSQENKVELSTNKNILTQFTFINKYL